jgi:hypothetical protein
MSSTPPRNGAVGGGLFVLPSVARLRYPQRVQAVESDNDGPNGAERRSPSRIVLPVTHATKENRRRTTGRDARS